MATTRSLKPVEQIEADAPLRREVRDGRYVLEEVDGETYDDCVESSATGEKDDQGRKLYDNAVLLKILLVKSLVEPRKTGKEINALPYSIRRDLLDATNDMYFPPLSDQFMAESLKARGWKVDRPETSGKG